MICLKRRLMLFLPSLLPRPPDSPLFCVPLPFPLNFLHVYDSGCILQSQSRADFPSRLLFHRADPPPGLGTASLPIPRLFSPLEGVGLASDGMVGLVDAGKMLQRMDSRKFADDFPLRNPADKVFPPFCLVSQYSPPREDNSIN